MRNRLLATILFWLHLPIVVLWFGLFLVPKSIWAVKVSFHFWFIAGIMFIQLLWGIYLTKKIDIICPLTTWMQYLRGYPRDSKKNYQHSYISELLQKLRIPVYYKGINILLLITLVLVTVQYIWFR